MSAVEALYHQAIKDWAQADHGRGRLAAPDAEVTLDNPLCGDRVHVGVRLEQGRIVELAQETRGCLLCRAAASLLGRRGPGLDGGQVAEVAGALAALLSSGTEPPAEWAELGMFAPAREHPSRHKCALLPFRALRKALAAAEGGKAPGAAEGDGASPASGKPWSKAK